MPRAKDPPPSREVRLHAAYANLTFSCTASDQDVRREELFRRLVLHHLLCHNVYTALDWRNIKTQQLCTYNFLQDYAKQLWPGKKAERLHLANPALTPRTKRSFIGAIDDHWSVRRNGPAPRPQQVASDSEPQSPGGAQVPSPQVGYGLDTFVGNMALSKVGKTFAKYIEVLLEPGLESAQMEDVEKLIEGILSTEYGGEIQAMPMSDGDQIMPSSDGIESMPMSDPVIKVEEGSD